MSDEDAAPGCPGPSDGEPSDAASDADVTGLLHPDVNDAEGVICAHLGYQAAMRTVRDLRAVSLRDFLS